MAAAFETCGAITATSLATAVACGADTKGAYTQIIASTSITTKMVYVIISWDGTGAIAEASVDIATGAAASETVVIPDLLFQGIAGTAGGGICHAFRLDIASGTRIAARGEGFSAAGTESVNLQVILCDTEVPLLTSPTVATYGAVLGGATGKGTVIDPGGVAHTKGGYVEITAAASATAQHAYLLIGRNANNARVDSNWLVDIATGAAASEVVKIANLHLSCNAVGDQVTPTRLGPFPADVFQNVRVSLNAQSDIIDAADRLFGATIIMVSGTVPAAGSGGGNWVLGSGVIR